MRLSIITINYNNAQGLEKTINSVLKQTNKEFEYIIIDGNSSDGSKSILDRYKNQITATISEPDTGIYNAMNKGVKYATGTYCLFLNSGDILAETTVIQKLNESRIEADIITGDTLIDNSNILWKAPDKVSLLTFYRGSLSHQSTLIKRELLIKYPYDEKLRIVSDWKFCIETLIIHNCSYSKYNNTISVYDKSGISSNESYFKVADEEKKAVLNELIPHRISMDYHKLIVGETSYEKLMIRISRNKKYAQLIYNILYPITKLYCLIFHKKLLNDLS